jgi:hypothetical protein
MPHEKLQRANEELCREPVEATTLNRAVASSPSFSF